jgi:hypothetical protein
LGTAVGLAPAVACGAGLLRSVAVADAGGAVLAGVVVAAGAAVSGARLVGSGEASDAGVGRAASRPAAGTVALGVTLGPEQAAVAKHAAAKHAARTRPRLPPGAR